MYRNKALALLLAAVLLAVLALPLSAAVNDGFARIHIHQSRVSVRVDDSYTLNWTVYNHPDSTITWTSTNERVATVSGGTIYAHQPGECQVSGKTADGFEDMVTVVVPGGFSEQYEDGYEGPGYYYDSEGRLRYTQNPYHHSRNSSSSRSSSSKRESSNPYSRKGATSEQAPRETVVEKAAVSNHIVLKDAASISAETLQAAVKANENVTISFDTRLDKKVIGRLSIPASSVPKFSGTIQTGVYVDCENTDSVVARFTNYFSNRCKVVFCDQATFAAPVEIIIKAKDLSVANLHAYTYDPAKNLYNPLTVLNVYKDANNYIHYTTMAGGYVILSDGALRAI